MVERVVVVYGYEKPSTRRNRIIASIVVWAILIPIFVTLWAAVEWWTLLPAALAVWGTWGYVQRGGMFEIMDKHDGGDGQTFGGGPVG